MKSVLSSVALIVVSMSLLLVVEAIRPLRENHRGRLVNLGLGAITVALNVCAALVVPLRSGSSSSVPAIVGTILALDLLTWISHWSMHKVPFLWRFHRIHHSDTFVDVTTTYRFHPFEAMYRQLWTVLPAIALGLPAQGFVLHRILSALNGLLEHANVRLPLDRFLRPVWVTPDMHKVHHSREHRETDSNYGNLLSLFDRMFGTFTPARDEVVYGLDVEPKQTRSIGKLLAMPFTRLSSFRPTP